MDDTEAEKIVSKMTIFARISSRIKNDWWIIGG